MKKRSSVNQSSAKRNGSRPADETKRPSKAPPESFRGSFLDSYREGGAFEKNNSRGARYFNAAANESIGSDVYDHLTGAGHISIDH
jgi:hypothetical protein